MGLLVGLGFFLSPSPSFRQWVDVKIFSKEFALLPRRPIQGHLPPRRTKDISLSISFTATGTAEDGRHGRDRARAHRGKEQFCWPVSASSLLSDYYVQSPYMSLPLCHFIRLINDHVLWRYCVFLPGQNVLGLGQNSWESSTDVDRQ